MCRELLWLSPFVVFKPTPTAYMEYEPLATQGSQ